MDFCWCCGEGKEAGHSQFLCEGCKAHGAERFFADLKFEQEKRDPREEGRIDEVPR